VTAPDGRSLEVGTGHVGFVTELEKAFGIRASCGELADRALALADDGHACWGPQMYELVRRDDEPTLDALELMLDVSDPRRRYFAASVLFCFALWLNEEETRYTDRIVETLVKRTPQEEDPEVLRMLIVGFFNHCTQPDRPEILRHADHPAAGVRAAVASSLAGANPADHPQEVRLLLTLSADAAGEVRAAATHALGRITPETPQIRDLLLTRLSDRDPDVVWAAANALGDRDDPRADTAILRAFFEDPQEVVEGRRGYSHIHRWSTERYEAASCGA
jgi:HEAT repeat protein